MRIFCYCIIFGLLNCVAFAQDSLPATSLFTSDAPLEVRLEVDLKALFKDVGGERESHPARFSYVNDAGDSMHFQMKIKTRGHFRRNPSHCNCPPLRLNFYKDKLAGTLFEGQNKLKMVTHCQLNKASYEQNLLQEYFIYKAYNLFTEASFRVRLMYVTYADSSGWMEPFTKYAFLIEDEDQMAARNGAKIQKLVMHPDQGDRKLTNQLCIFEYMVGNTDFSIGQQHNVKLMSPGPQQLIIPVPYDFDWSGLVNAPYAKPNPILQLGSVRERLFRGFCRTEEEFEEAFQLFREKKEEILRLYRELPDLDEKEKDKGLEYLEDFFEIINNPKRIKREFIKQCRTG